jgi:hypothetical protein
MHQPKHCPFFPVYPWASRIRATLLRCQSGRTCLVRDISVAGLPPGPREQGNRGVNDKWEMHCLLGTYSVVVDNHDNEINADAKMKPPVTKPAAHSLCSENPYLRCDNDIWNLCSDNGNMHAIARKCRPIPILQHQDKSVWQQTMTGWVRVIWPRDPNRANTKELELRSWIQIPSPKSVPASGAWRAESPHIQFQKKFNTCDAELPASLPPSFQLPLFPRY